MSADGNERPENQPRERLPGRHWKASEPFWDLRGSHWIEVGLTIALVFVGCAQVYIYVREANIMDTQATIAANASAQNAAVNRAFVTVNGIEAVPIKDDSGKIKSWSLVASVENSGNTPTKDLQYVIGMEAVRSSDHDPYSVLLQGSTNLWATWNWDLNRTYIGPKSPLPIPVSGNMTGASDIASGYIGGSFNGIGPDLADQVRKGEYFVIADGEFRYRDRLSPDQLRKTRFCYMLDGSSFAADSERPVLTICPLHNCADEECDEEDSSVPARLAKLRGG